RFDLAGDDGHLALRVSKIDRLLPREILVARSVVLSPPDEYQVAERLGQQLALLGVGKPHTPHAVATRTLRENVLDGPLRRLELLRRTGQLVVDPQQDELAR